MSRVAEVTLMAQQAKWVLIFGLGYLAARNPLLAAKVGFRIGAVLLKGVIAQGARDIVNVSRILYQELAKPVLARDASIISHASRLHMSDVIARGPIWGTTMILTTGGALAHSIDTAVEYLGLDTPSSPDSPLAH